jgi:hypothetical protein
MKNFGLLILGIIVGASAMYFYCIKDETVAVNSLSAPKGLITPEQAKVLDVAFDLKHRIINDSLFKKSTDGGDNRSSWWSIADIQNYINHAENETGELGYTMDGLRLYLGSYPDTKGETGLTTMFFIPTGYKNTAQGSMLSTRGASRDIIDADGLNVGQNGNPPSANYPH